MYLITAVERRLDARQRCGGSADPAVAGCEILLEHQAAAIAHRIDTGVVVSKEASMLESVEPNRRRVAVIDRPPDVVVTAHVGAPHRGRRLGREPVQGGAEEPSVL